jgi:hypothetical protein
MLGAACATDDDGSAPIATEETNESSTNDNGDSGNPQTSVPSQRAGPLTIEEYFLELVKVDDGARQRQGEVGADLDPIGLLLQQSADESPEHEVELLSEYFELLLPLTEERIAQLKAMDLPSEVEAYHEAFIHVAEGQLNEMHTWLSRLANATSIDDLSDLLGTEDERFGKALLVAQPCFDLSGVAFREGVDVNLACTSPELWGQPLLTSRRPDFRAEIAKAQEAGVAPYWFGEGFQLEQLAIRLTGEFEFYEAPGFQAVYSDLNLSDDATDRGSIIDVVTYREGGAAEERLTTLLENPDNRVEDVTVGGWPARLVLGPEGRVFVFVDVGQMDVVVQTGPLIGKGNVNLNPLSDPQLLIDTVAANLRPY